MSAADEFAWMGDGACVGVPALDFFMEANQPGYGENRAACLDCCSTCPVVDRCLSFALGNREEAGIWGGKTASQREAMSNGPYRDEVEPDDPFAPEEL